ncbi:MAG: hypothetical protein M1825_002406 [Sarcosagium campestre]|nr:MAG: hypothetical protein M1825_002406 [Sarcosagium campestre]
MTLLSQLRVTNARNLQVLRNSTFAEISGSIGDLGTLLPLLIALTLHSSVFLSSSLVVSGIANIATGLYFGVPLPVQPMKAIAAMAIGSNYSKEQTASAGIMVGALLAFGTVTGLLGWFAAVVPIPVVKGVQVGVGLSLVLSAGAMLLQFPTSSWPDDERWSDNLVWVLAAGLLVMFTTLPTGMKRARRFPTALCLFVLGIVFAMARLIEARQGGRPAPDNALPRVEGWQPRLLAPSFDDIFDVGFWTALGQLPVTVLNSVIAVTSLSADLLPSVPAPSTTALGYSIAAFSLVGCWFGAMPICHGSGGLAAQYHFGARSGASVMMLGAFKLVVGLLFGESLLPLLHRFPRAFLGVMMLAAGLELAKAGESLNRDASDLWLLDDVDGSRLGCRPLDDAEREKRSIVMLLTVAGLLAFQDTAAGFLLGMLGHYMLYPPTWPRPGDSNVSGVSRRRSWWRRRSGSPSPDDERQSLLEQDPERES